ncbi:phosphoribosylformylglycinamidine synthase, purS [Sulfobacillus acidophilus DSM 10332]|uniref:Phosphoribosylformylglycinamidine synthase subunit PurS n=1 Tax=Sulfobacillus acidophilus (strain ATCC 700253 / DSM 10332 / NAL) TaxID=679936 RepID=G8TXD4_SULAD|nr:phosphoribosylformylglycinamidine synthase, purS [Sulfobacillus acidophilus DSM 10332]
MARFRLQVQVMPKPEILDPAGEATLSVLQRLGYPVSGVRIGKHIVVEIEAPDADEARELGQQMARRLLANPVMEHFGIEVDPV